MWWWTNDPLSLGLRPGEAASFSVFRDEGYKMSHALAHVGGAHAIRSGGIYDDQLFIRSVPYPDAVPEPGTVATIGGGLMGLAMWSLRRKRHHVVTISPRDR
jgi:PEP-CTERM motif-containing protein